MLNDAHCSGVGRIIGRELLGKLRVMVEGRDVIQQFWPGTNEAPRLGEIPRSQI